MIFPIDPAINGSEYFIDFMMQFKMVHEVKLEWVPLFDRKC